MNPEEIEELYEKLSEEHGVPMPTYIIYDRRPKVLTPMIGTRSWGEQVLLKITISRKVGSFFTLNPSIGEDPFGFIMLSKGRRGIRKDEAVHEFIHYFDHLVYAFNFLYPETETPTELAYKIRVRKLFPRQDEKSVRSRTRSQIRRLEQ